MEPEKKEGANCKTNQESQEETRGSCLGQSFDPQTATGAGECLVNPPSGHCQEGHQVRKANKEIDEGSNLWVETFLVPSFCVGVVRGYITGGRNKTEEKSNASLFLLHISSPANNLLPEMAEVDLRVSISRTFFSFSWSLIHLKLIFAIRWSFPFELFEFQ